MGWFGQAGTKTAWCTSENLDSHEENMFPAFTDQIYDQFGFPVIFQFENIRPFYNQCINHAHFF
jgi:hypothetical protein